MKEKREGLCEMCERTYGVWCAPNETWNAVVRRAHEDDFHFLCPTCFTMLADARGFHDVFQVGPGGPFRPQPDWWKLLMSIAPNARFSALDDALREQGLAVDMVEAKSREAVDKSPKKGDRVKGETA